MIEIVADCDLQRAIEALSDDDNPTAQREFSAWPSRCPSDRSLRLTPRQRARIEEALEAFRERRRPDLLDEPLGLTTQDLA